ncbi:primosomal protein DnaI, partial [Staphylococcus epidermidis]|nr:primosomal protein DnaI [Staphylococcus epidermidis]
MKSFRNIMGDSQNLDKRIQKIKQNVINDTDVKHFLEKNRSNITNEMIDEDLNVLQEYKDQQKVYDGHRYDDCPNFVKGHVPELYIENERIKIRYLPCPGKIKQIGERLVSNFLPLT